MRQVIHILLPPGNAFWTVEFGGITNSLVCPSQILDCNFTKSKQTSHNGLIRGSGSSSPFQCEIARRSHIVRASAFPRPRISISRMSDFWKIADAAYPCMNSGSQRGLGVTFHPARRRASTRLLLLRGVTGALPYVLTILLISVVAVGAPAAE